MGVVRYLLRKGAEVTVTDLKGADELEPSLRQLQGLPVRYILGTNEVEDLGSFDLIVRNPAVPFRAPILQRARELGIPVTMEMNLFFRECRARIVGVTGTKGKSTTASLIAHLLSRARPSVILAGNLGISALDQLEKCTVDSIVVLELSSWQLEGLGAEGLSPDIAVVTRIFRDHMDVYADFHEYLEAKLQIARHQSRQGCLVVCRSDPYWHRFAVEARGKVVTYGTAAGPADVWIEGNWLYARDFAGCPRTVAALDGWKLGGGHNLSNLAAAAATALEFGLTQADLEDGISTFKGLSHRLELVGEVNGVKFVDDSAATIPEAAAAAVQAFAADKLIVICGGSDKRLNPAPLAEALQRCKGVAFLAGSGTQQLIQALESLRPGNQRKEFRSLEEALAWCEGVASPGDVVLLSPGYASFGMFVNYRERGRRFREWVASRLSMRRK